MIITVNGKQHDVTRYDAFHGRRFDKTIDLVRNFGGGRTIELGSHPFAMTARLLAEDSVELLATVSAEEVTAWPDEIPVTRHPYILAGEDGHTASFFNYSANLERTLFSVFDSSDDQRRADLVLACEIIEHLTRAPHTMMLNINSWLNVGGRVLITTPNGCQFQNPFRLRPRMPAFRYSSYARHNFVHTMDTLKDLLEVTGFEIELASYWSPYSRSAGAKLYRYLADLPFEYARAKFCQTLVIVGRKIEDRKAAIRLPKACAPDGLWENVDGVPEQAARVATTK